MVSHNEQMNDNNQQHLPQKFGKKILTRRQNDHILKTRLYAASTLEIDHIICSTAHQTYTLIVSAFYHMHIHINDFHGILHIEDI